MLRGRHLPWRRGRRPSWVPRGPGRRGIETGGSHALGAESCPWGRGPLPSSGLRSFVLPQTPRPKRPPARRGQGLGPAASCSLPLKCKERSGLGVGPCSRWVPTLSLHPCGHRWGEGFPSSLRRPETGRLCFPGLAAGRALRLFLHPLPMNFASRVKAGYKIAKKSRTVCACLPITWFSLGTQR